MPDKFRPYDPKGLVFEAYRIDDLSPQECRSIFLDWALSLPAEQSQENALVELMADYGRVYPDHPMTRVLRDAQMTAPRPKRRGGWRGRRN